MSGIPLPPPDALDDDSEPENASTLLNRFFELSRPITDACHEPGLDMNLGDPARFAALIGALEQGGHDGVEQTLLVFLDEFCQLEQRSYDELYLWSIVELSRRNPAHVESFWPLALTLDLRFRSEPWRRPPEASLVEQPYRLTELLLYFYAVSTEEPERDPDSIYQDENGSNPHVRPQRRFPSLLACLRRILHRLNETERTLLMDTLRDLNWRERRPAFGDAYGILLRGIKSDSN